MVNVLVSFSFTTSNGVYGNGHSVSTLHHFPENSTDVQEVSARLRESLTERLRADGELCDDSFVENLSIMGLTKLSEGGTITYTDAFLCGLIGAIFGVLAFVALSGLL